MMTIFETIRKDYNIQRDFLNILVITTGPSDGRDKMLKNYKKNCAFIPKLKSNIITNL